ncbi:MAG: hypothetical protein PUB96_02570 [Helicobacteraceae bacterium]|nr:hypothetical protein [Helicobacteraceae bacterium]
MLFSIDGVRFVNFQYDKCWAGLSGVLGLATWIFSNSYGLDWRKINESKCDVW